MKGDLKAKISLILYVVAIPLSFVQDTIADVLYLVVALIWLVPDRRIESKLDAGRADESGRPGGIIRG